LAVAAATLCAVGAGTAQSADAAGSKPAAPKLRIGASDWPAYLRNPAHSSAAYSVPSITQARVSALATKWSFSVPVVAGHGNGLQASPTVAAGRVFIGSTNGRFYVLNEATGKVIWSKQLDTLSAHQAGECGQAGITSTATVAPAPGSGALTVYIAGARYMYALDAATGVQKWKALVGPAGSLNTPGYRIWSSPTVAGGVVLMGISSNCDAPLIRGGVVAFDQRTGKVRGTWYAVPSGKVGASVWSSLASDGSSAWVSTGNPDPTGTQAYRGYAIVRLALPSLKEADHFIVTLPIDADKDFGSSPTLFSATLNGTATQMVGACNKNGVYYALRAKNLAAGPVWTLQAGSTSKYPDMCITSAAWDYLGKRLFLAANSTTVHGAPAAASVRQLDPTTGAVGWQTALPCLPLTSPTLNGNSSLLAVSTWCSTGTSSRVYVLNASTGAIVASYPLPGQSFVQPVWANNLLFLGGGPGSGGKLIALG
jgi:polyvinyl alcohol dehydrogenase (cytochrome)